jgi:hypothetical protein
MPSLDDLVARASDLAEGEFLAAYPQPFLLSESKSGVVAGATASALPPESPTVHDFAPTLADTNAVLPLPGAIVLFVKRRDDGKTSSIITVGRSDDCDLKLAHPLVSKRHAYFTQSEGAWCVADAESSNGTYADGNRLEPHKLHKLTDSEVLRFGPEVKYRFFGSLAFYRYLVYRSRIKK